MKSAEYQAGLAGYVRARSRLVLKLSEAGVTDPRVLAAIKNTPRHVLIPEILRVRAYQDRALPIGEGQTISAPGVVGPPRPGLKWFALRRWGALDPGRLGL